MNEMIIKLTKTKSFVYVTAR